MFYDKLMMRLVAADLRQKRWLLPLICDKNEGLLPLICDKKMARFQNHFSKRAELFLTYDDVFFKLLFVNLLRLTSCWG